MMASPIRLPSLGPTQTQETPFAVHVLQCISPMRFTLLAIRDARVRTGSSTGARLLRANGPRRRDNTVNCANVVLAHPARTDRPRYEMDQPLVSASPRCHDQCK